MLFARFSLLAAVASTLVGTVAGKMKIIAPGGPTLWWVVNSDNTLVWDCSDKTYDEFNAFLMHPSAVVLNAPLAISPALENSACSAQISYSRLSVSPLTGYTVQLTNISDNTQIYATSEPFEIKHFMAPYPDPSATPTGTSSNPSSSSNGSSSSGNGGFKDVLSALFVAIVVGVMTA